MSLRVVIASNGNWMGLYDEDGTLLVENEILDAEDILDSLDLNYSVVHVEVTDGESLPENFEDLSFVEE